VSVRKPITRKGEATDSDLLWGCEAIGRAINRSARQVRHLLSIGALGSVQKCGGHWVASRAALLRELGCDGYHVTARREIRAK
jgi:hypothetical protein